MDFTFNNFFEWIKSGNTDGMEKVCAKARETQEMLIETLGILNNYTKYKDNYIFCALGIILYHIQIKDISNIAINPVLENFLISYQNPEHPEDEKCLLLAAECLVCYVLTYEPEYDFNFFSCHPIPLRFIIEKLIFYRSSEFTHGYFSDEQIISQLQNYIPKIPLDDPNCSLAGMILKLKVNPNDYMKEIFENIESIDFNQIDKELYFSFLRELSFEGRYNSEFSQHINQYMELLEGSLEPDKDNQEIWEIFAALILDSEFIEIVMSQDLGCDLLKELFSVIISSKIEVDSDQYKQIQDLLSHLFSLPPNFAIWPYLVEFVATIGSDFSPTILRALYEGFEEYCSLVDKEQFMEDGTTFLTIIGELLQESNTNSGAFAILAYSSIKSLEVILDLFNILFESINKDDPLDGLVFIGNYFSQDLSLEELFLIDNFYDNLTNYLYTMLHINTTKTVSTLKDIAKSRYEFPSLAKFIEELAESNYIYNNEEYDFYVFLQFLISYYPRGKEDEKHEIIEFLKESNYLGEVNYGIDFYVGRFNTIRSLIDITNNEASSELIPVITKIAFEITNNLVSFDECEIHIPIAKTMISIVSKTDIVPNEIKEYLKLVFNNNNEFPVVPQHFRLLLQLTQSQIFPDGPEHLLNAKIALELYKDSYSVFDPENTDLFNWALELLDKEPEINSVAEWAKRTLPQQAKDLEKLFNMLRNCKYIIEEIKIKEFLNDVDLTENQYLSKEIFEFLNEFSLIGFFQPRIIAAGLLSQFRDVSGSAIDLFAKLLDYNCLDPDSKYKCTEALFHSIFLTYWLTKENDIYNILKNLLNDENQSLSLRDRFLQVAHCYEKEGFSEVFFEAFMDNEDNDNEEKKIMREMVISRFSFLLSSRIYSELPYVTEAPSH